MSVKRFHSRKEFVIVSTINQHLTRAALIKYERRKWYRKRLTCVFCLTLCMRIDNGPVSNSLASSLSTASFGVNIFICLEWGTARDGWVFPMIYYCKCTIGQYLMCPNIPFTLNGHIANRKSQIERRTNQLGVLRADFATWNQCQQHTARKAEFRSVLFEQPLQKICTPCRLAIPKKLRRIKLVIRDKYSVFSKNCNDLQLYVHRWWSLKALNEDGLWYVIIHHENCLLFIPCER